MDLLSLIETYGYAVLFVGAFLEGETVLVLAGFAAHRGYLDIRLVIAVAFVGGLLGDQLYFAVGRLRGAALVAWFPRLARYQPRLDRLLARYHTFLIVAIRFLYGLRIAGPLLMGVSKAVLASRFIALNAAGALLWAVSIGLAGYLFGQALELVLADIRRYELAAALVIIGAGAALWGWQSFRERRRT